MKKLIVISGIAILTFGCAAAGMNGWLVTNVTEPVNATSNERGSKTGESSCVSVLGIVAAGDCSINKAANQGNIIKVKSVDTKTISVLGLFTKKTTIVTGE